MSPRGHKTVPAPRVSTCRCHHCMCKWGCWWSWQTNSSSVGSWICSLTETRTKQRDEKQQNTAWAWMVLRRPPDVSVDPLEHELNRSFISDLLHVCDRAAVTAVPLVDEVLLRRQEPVTFCFCTFNIQFFIKAKAPQQVWSATVHLPSSFFCLKWLIGANYSLIATLWISYFRTNQ